MSIFPSISPPVERAAASALPLCREVAWDYQNNVPVWRRGKPLYVEGKEAVKVWIFKALKTPRYKYEIYTWLYGSEFESLMGRAYSDRLKTAECPRYLRECLLINPYVTSVTDIHVEFENSTLTVSCKAGTIYGEVYVYAAL